MSDNDRIPELITKLIYDTNCNRIPWNGGIIRGRGEFHADYANRYRLFFLAEYPKGTSYLLQLSKIDDGTTLLYLTDSILIDLYDAIVAQGGHCKLNDAIEDILNYH